MNKNILIIGDGYIGRKLAKALNARLSTKRVRLYEDVEVLIKKYRPKILINAIGHVGKSNVDDCEKAVDKTLNANTFVPILMAEVALRYNIKLVHISSGCIYHYNYGHQKPILESRNPDYYNLFYSRTKIYTEDALLRLSRNKNMVNILIVRIRVPLDNVPNSKNLLTKLIKYGKVIDAPNSVTYIPDFIEALKHLIRKDAKGLYNVMAKGALYYPDLMKLYQKYDPKFKYDVIKLKNLPLKRTSLIMSTTKLQKSGFKVRQIKEIIKECVEKYVQSS
ncbi:MAG: sugar nucleotide-binding protein [Candidatus Omnitrophica bacterium]|nr:sugar nucleotide-binding protein [Candidatus Omnitrophota bacterium]